MRVVLAKALRKWIPKSFVYEELVTHRLFDLQIEEEGEVAGKAQELIKVLKKRDGVLFTRAVALLAAVVSEEELQAFSERYGETKNRKMFTMEQVMGREHSAPRTKLNALKSLSKEEKVNTSLSNTFSGVLCQRKATRWQCGRGVCSPRTAPSRAVHLSRGRTG